jgi:hypothetical protein
MLLTLSGWSAQKLPTPAAAISAEEVEWSSDGVASEGQGRSDEC